MNHDWVEEWMDGCLPLTISCRSSILNLHNCIPVSVFLSGVFFLRTKHDWAKKPNTPPCAIDRMHVKVSHYELDFWKRMAITPTFTFSFAYTGPTAHHLQIFPT